MQDLEARNLGISRYFDYYEFIVFKAPSYAILKRVWGRIKNYNRNLESEDNEPFILFFEETVKKVSAAIKIQWFFRNWVIRKKLKKSYAKTIIEWRAVLWIQAYWRSYKIKARIRMNSNIRSHISTIKTSTIYLEETIYLNIMFIFSKWLLKFKEQFFDFYFTDEYKWQTTFHKGYFDSGIYGEVEFWKNDPNALVHFVPYMCQVKDFNTIVNYNK